MTVDKYSWGYRRNSRALDAYTIQELINQLVETVSFGGTLKYEKNNKTSAKLLKNNDIYCTYILKN